MIKIAAVLEKTLQWWGPLPEDQWSSEIKKLYRWEWDMEYVYTNGIRIEMFAWYEYFT